MDRRVLPFVVSVPLVCLFASPAGAAPKDAAATKLYRDAIEGDYLGMQFASAERKLKQAIALCGDSGCAPKVLAQLHRELGVVYLANKNSADARSEFAAALKIDPELALLKDLATPESTQLLAEVKAAAAPPPAAEPVAEPKSAAAPCVPGSEGCEPKREEVGGACSANEGCVSGACVDAVCAAPAAAAKTCQSDTDCGADHCRNGVCGGSEAKNNWLSLAIQQDGLFLPSVNEACSADATYTCFDGPDHYLRRNLVSGTDNVQGGFSLATTRVLIGYDRVVHPNITVGVRLGFAFNHGPTAENGTSFLPVHAEARAAYWFGSGAAEGTGLRPYVLLGAGVAHFDAKRRFTAVDAGEDYHLQAWRRAGAGFASLGLGVLQPVGASSGVFAELKLLQTFGESATGVGAQLGYALGL